jgi:hypothetical protein
MHLQAEQMCGLVNPQFGGFARAGNEFAAADSPENAARESLPKEMRQGSASCGRHVAPALLLC